MEAAVLFSVVSVVLSVVVAVVVSGTAVVVVGASVVALVVNFVVDCVACSVEIILTAGSALFESLLFENKAIMVKITNIAVTVIFAALLQFVFDHIKYNPMGKNKIKSIITAKSFMVCNFAPQFEQTLTDESFSVSHFSHFIIDIFSFVLNLI